MARISPGRTKRKIVVTRDMGPDANALLESSEEWPSLEVHRWEEDRPAPRDWFLQNVSGATALLMTLCDKVDEELLRAAGPELEIISTMSVGTDHIDLAAVKKHNSNIRVGNTPDVLTDAVADITVMLALMASRNVTQATQLLYSGMWGNSGWSPFALCGPQIGTGTTRKKPYTVGFLGFGRIAQATLRRLAPYGISRCIYSNSRSARLEDPLKPTEADHAISTALGIPEVHAVPLTCLASESDLVIVLAPGGNETFHIVDEGFLRGMRKTAILVNVARGSLVDTDALIRVLKEGVIHGAGLDVIEGEPNINLDHPLLHEPRCVLLPHIGSATLETRTAMAMMAVRNLLNGLTGLSLESEVEL